MASTEVLREFLVSLGFQTDEASFKKFLTGVGAVTEPVLKLGAAAAAAATAVEVMVERVARQMEDLYYASQRTYAAAASLQAVGFAARQVGLEAGQGTDLLEGLGRALRTNPGTEGLIGALGIQSREANGHLRDSSQILDDLLKRFEQMPRFQALQYGGILGFNPDTLNQVLNNLPEFIRSQDDARRSLREFGLDQTQVSADSVDFARHLNTLEQNFGNLTTRVAHDWMPTAEHLIDDVNGLVVRFGEWNDTMSGTPGKIGAIVTALGGLVGVLSLFAKGRAAIGGVVGGAARLLGSAAGGVLGPAGAFLGTMLYSAPTNTGEQEHINAERAAPVISFFMQQGWSREQATGIAANLLAESSINPNQSGDNGQAFGVAQWHADRQANFAKWAGHDIHSSTLAEQLGFINYELRSGMERNAGAVLSHAQTAKQAAEAFSLNYERPAGGAAMAAARGQMAVNLSQSTNITVNGATDPAGTAKKIGDVQGRVNGDLARNLSSVVQ